MLFLCGVQYWTKSVVILNVYFSRFLKISFILQTVKVINIFIFGNTANEKFFSHSFHIFIKTLNDTKVRMFLFVADFNADDFVPTLLFMSQPKNNLFIFQNQISEWKNSFKMQLKSELNDKFCLIVKRKLVNVWIAGDISATFYSSCSASWWIGNTVVEPLFPLTIHISFKPW